MSEEKVREEIRKILEEPQEITFFISLDKNKKKLKMIKHGCSETLRSVFAQLLYDDIRFAYLVLEASEIANRRTEDKKNG